MRLSYIAAVALVAAACSDPSGPTALTRGDVAARYATALPSTAGATGTGSLVFTTTEDGVTTDHAAQGADIQLTLAADGSASGHLFVPDVPTGNGTTEDFEADLAGSWALENGIVTLSHDADTFLRNMPLTVRGDRLEGDRTFGGVRVRISLLRQ